MRGSVKKRPGGYTIVYDLAPDADGKRRQRRESGFRTKREAQERLTAALRELDTGTALDPTRLTVGEYLDHWLATEGPRVRPSSRERYEQIVAKHLVPAIGTVPLTKLSAAHIGRLHTALAAAGLAPITVRAYHRLLVTALRAARRWHLVAHNVAELVAPPRHAKAIPRHWDTPTARRFLALAEPDPDAALYVLALRTGMRRGELLGLHWADVDLERGVIRIHRNQIGSQADEAEFETKGGGARVVDIPPRQIALLREHRKRQVELRLRHADRWRDRGLVFCEPPAPNRDGGRPVARSTADYRWTRLVARLGLPALHLHGLRHTHATMLLEAGAHPKIVQERLGHASMAMTMDVYSHVMPTLARAAIDLLETLLNAPENPASDAHVTNP